MLYLYCKTHPMQDMAFLERKYVDSISQKDPKLETNEGMNLKNLLYLFERDVAIKTLQAG